MGRSRMSGRQTAYEEDRAYRERYRSGAEAPGMAWIVSEKGREYVQGSVVRKYATQDWPAESPVRELDPKVRKNREKAKYMNAGYVMFLAAALCAAAFILVNYIQLQSDLTNMIRIVADKESSLNKIRISNDEKYNQIIRSIDLEEIKRVAIGELGMGYAKEGQIVGYSNEESDYMRQITGSSQ